MPDKLNILIIALLCLSLCITGFLYSKTRDRKQGFLSLGLLSVMILFAWRLLEQGKAALNVPNWEQIALAILGAYFFHKAHHPDGPFVNRPSLKKFILIAAVFWGVIFCGIMFIERSMRHSAGMVFFPLVLIALSIFMVWVIRRIQKIPGGTGQVQSPESAVVGPETSARAPVFVLIERIRQVQALMPELRWDEKDGEIKVEPDTESGFPVSVIFESMAADTKGEPPSLSQSRLPPDSFAYTVYYLADHQHFSTGEETEALAMFLMGLSDVVRLQVISRSGEDYGFFTEIRKKGQDEYCRNNQSWYFKSAMWKFWIPREMRYLQNRHLTALQVEKMMDEMVPQGQKG